MDLLLSNASLVSMEKGDQGYNVTPNCAIAINQGRIRAISCSATDLTQWQGSAKQHINCQGKLVTPGLIDCHTHLVYAGNRANEFEMRLTGVPYQEIARQGGGILSTVKATRAASEDELVELALPRLEGLLRSGATQVEIKSGYGLTLDDELKMLRAAKQLEQHRRVKVSTTLLAAHALPPEYRDDADSYIDLVCQTIIPAAAEEKLADAVDVFCEGIGFDIAQTERVFAAAKQYGLNIKGHTEQLSNLGGSALAARYGALSVDHIEYLDAQGVSAIADAGTVATLLPGAFYFLRETQKPPIELLRNQQVPMALSTDLNPGTSPFADLRLMMNMASTLFGLTPEENLRGVTCHAAKALGTAQRTGQLKNGYDADLAIWNTSHPADLSYQVGTSLLSQRIVDGVMCHD